MYTLVRNYCSARPLNLLFVDVLVAVVVVVYLTSLLILLFVKGPYLARFFFVFIAEISDRIF